MKKICKNCQIEKEVEEMVKGYNSTKQGKSFYYKTICKKCYNKKRDERRKKGPITEGRRKAALERSRRQYANSEGRRQYQREYRLINNYGITLEEYNNLSTKQGGKCKICGNISDRVLDVDHCHITGKVRGLLCTDCNGGLGKFRDNIHIMQEAINYLKIYG